MCEYCEEFELEHEDKGEDGFEYWEGKNAVKDSDGAGVEVRFTKADDNTAMPPDYSLLMKLRFEWEETVCTVIVDAKEHDLKKRIELEETVCFDGINFCPKCGRDLRGEAER